MEVKITLDGVFERIGEVCHEFDTGIAELHHCINGKLKEVREDFNINKSAIIGAIETLSNRVDNLKGQNMRIQHELHVISDKIDDMADRRERYKRSRSRRSRLKRSNRTWQSNFDLDS